MEAKHVKYSHCDWTSRSPVDREHPSASRMDMALGVTEKQCARTREFEY